MAKLTLNGVEIEAPDGAPLVEVIKNSGIFISNLCYIDGLPPYAGCRTCLVEIEGARGLQLACTAASPTAWSSAPSTAEVLDARQAVLSIINANHSDRCLTCHRRVHCKPGDICLRDDIVTHRCLTCSKNYRCELQTTNEMLEMAELRAVGWARTRTYYESEQPEADRANPFLEFDPQMCIICTRCVRACDEIRHTGAITLAGRGFSTRIAFGAGGAVHESNCDFCGACIDVCPTATLMEKPNKWIAKTEELGLHDLQQLLRRLHDQHGRPQRQGRHRQARPPQPRERRPDLRPRPLPLRRHQDPRAPHPPPRPRRRRPAASYVRGRHRDRRLAASPTSSSSTARRASASWSRPGPRTKRPTSPRSSPAASSAPRTSTPPPARSPAPSAPPSRAPSAPTCCPPTWRQLATAKTIVVIADDLESSHNVAALRVKDAVVCNGARLIVVSSRYGEVCDFIAPPPAGSIMPSPQRVHSADPTGVWLRPSPAASSRPPSPRGPAGLEAQALRTPWASTIGAARGSRRDPQGHRSRVISPSSSHLGRLALLAGAGAAAAANLAIAAKGDRRFGEPLLPADRSQRQRHPRHGRHPRRRRAGVSAT